MTGFRYKGWREVVGDYDDDDYRGSMTYAVHDDGRTVSLDVSQWNFRMTADLFAMLVDLGFPTRQSLGLTGPLWPADVEAIYADRLGKVAA